MKCIAIILSGGTGSRMNMDIPKQYVQVGGRMIITESIITFAGSGLIDGIQIVADKQWQDNILKEYAENVKSISSGAPDKDADTEHSDEVIPYKFTGFSAPGANRQLSILNALRDIRQNMDYDDIVIIHDAARTLVTVGMITAYIEAIYDKPPKSPAYSLDKPPKSPADSLDKPSKSSAGSLDKPSKSPVDSLDSATKPSASAGSLDNMEISGMHNHSEESDRIRHDGVMPVIPMKDTVYYSDNGSSVSRLLDRDRMFAGQAPEVFRYWRYLDACEKLMPDRIMDIRGSTEPAIMAGLDVVMVPGDEKNFKITTIEDMERYREIVDGR